MFNRYVRVSEVAKATGLSATNICRLIREGEFPSARPASSNGFPGNPGYEVTLYDLEAFMRQRDEKKNAPKKEKRNRKSTNEEIKQLLTELHTNMIQQAEIIGKLLDKL